MQSAVAVPTCTNCFKWLGVEVPLTMTSRGDWVCSREGCGYTKSLEFGNGRIIHGHRIVLAPEFLLSVILSVGATLFKITSYVLAALPLAIVLAPLFLIAYVLISYRVVMGAIERS